MQEMRIIFLQLWGSFAVSLDSSSHSLRICIGSILKVNLVQFYRRSQKLTTRKTPIWENGTAKGRTIEPCWWHPLVAWRQLGGSDKDVRWLICRNSSMTSRD